MGNGYRIKDQSRPHFVTFTVVEWVDVFTKWVYREILFDSMRYCMVNKGMVIYGYVIMSNHVHMILLSEKEALSDLIRDFKKYTSKKIVEEVSLKNDRRSEWMMSVFRKNANRHSRNSEFQLWKYGNHPEEIYSEKFLWTKLDYIHLNPVRAGIVKKASSYTCSSAGNYVYGRGPVDVTLVDNPMRNVYSSSVFSNGLRW